MLASMELDGREAKVVAALRQALETSLGSRLKGLTVFGSRARGEARPGSDLDVLVLVDQADSQTRHQVYCLAYDTTVANDFTLDLAPLVLGQAEFDRMVKRERRLALDILRDGIPA